MAAERGDAGAVRTTEGPAPAWPTERRGGPAREPGAPGAAIPLCVPELTGREEEYVRTCIRSGWVSSAGPFVERFEAEVARRVGARHAVACASGTAALHIALLLSGVEAGDAVLVSSLSFIAPANAVRYVGARPVFVDAEREHWQLCPVRIASYLSEECERREGTVLERATGRRVRAILAVHVLGHPAPMAQLCELGSKYGLPIVEDASESLGALYEGRPTGSIGDVGCFSFNGNKIVTSGGGGMIVMGDAAAASRARYLTTQAKDDPVEYVHREIGYNYRLTNLQAALGCAQIERLEDRVAEKRRIARRYEEAFARIPGLSAPREAEGVRSSFWLSAVRIDPRVYGRSRTELWSYLADRGIETRPLWQPLHLSPAHAPAHVLGGAVAEDVQTHTLCLPSSSGLTSGDQEAVIEALERGRRG